MKIFGRLSFLGEASGCRRLVGLRGSGRLVGVFLNFFKITKKKIEEKNLKKIGRLSFFGEASGCGRLLGEGG